MSEAQSGKKLSYTTKLKLSKAQQGKIRMISDGTKRKMSNAQKGKK